MSSNASERRLAIEHLMDAAERLCTALIRGEAGQIRLALDLVRVMSEVKKQETHL